MVEFDICYDPIPIKNVIKISIAIASICTSVYILHAIIKDLIKLINKF